MYATHILDGLDGWPSKMLHVSNGKVVHYGHVHDLALVEDAAAGPRARESGSLYRTVRARLRSELEAEAKAEAAAPKGAATAFAMEVDAPPKPAAVGSRFDRFGGAGRQMNMYG